MPSLTVIALSPQEVLAIVAAALAVTEVKEANLTDSGLPAGTALLFVVSYADGTAGTNGTESVDANGNASFQWSPASTSAATVTVYQSIVSGNG